MTKTLLNRRVFVGAVLTALPSLGMAGADDDGSNAQRFKSTRKYVFTLDEMLRMSLDDKQKLLNRTRDPRVTIIGFSNYFKAWVIVMAMHDTPRVKRVIREISKIKDSEKRWEYLQKEREKIRKEVDALNKKAEAILKKHGDNRVHNMRVTVIGARMAELDEFSEGLKAWQKNVIEGSVPPPKVKP